MTAAAVAREDLIRIGRTGVVTVSSAVVIIIPKISAALVAVDLTIMVGVDIRHSTATLAGGELLWIVRTAIIAVPGAITVCVAEIITVFLAIKAIVTIDIYVGDAAAAGALKDLIGVSRTLIVTVPNAVVVSVFEVITDLITVENPVVVIIDISHTAATFPWGDLASVIRTFVIAVSGAVTVAVVEVITVLETVEDVIVIEIDISDATAAIASLNLCAIVRAPVIAVPGSVIVIISEIIAALFETIDQVVPVDVNVRDSTPTLA